MGLSTNDPSEGVLALECVKLPLRLPSSAEIQRCARHDYNNEEGKRFFWKWTPNDYQIVTYVVHSNRYG